MPKKTTLRYVIIKFQKVKKKKTQKTTNNRYPHQKIKEEKKKKKKKVLNPERGQRGKTPYLYRSKNKNYLPSKNHYYYYKNIVL